MTRLLFFFAVPLMFCGCLSILPEGDAPKGRITDNARRKTATQEELENACATALAAHILLNADTIKAIDAADAPSERVMQSVSGVTGTQCIKGAFYRLEFKDGVFKLVSGKTLLHWQYPEKE